MCEQVGTQKLIVTGRIRLSLKPLMDDLPIVGAVHVSPKPPRMQAFDALVNLPSFQAPLLTL